MLLIDGENFKGKMKAVFKEAGKERPAWSEYDFKGLLEKVLDGLAWTPKFACQPCMINRTNIQVYEETSYRTRREGSGHQPHQERRNFSGAGSC